MPFSPSDAVSVLKVAQPDIRLSDPHICSDARARLSLLHALYEPLVRRAANGHFEPALAFGWTLSDDACQWTFKLRQGVQFHDGQAFTADDAAASLIRVRDEQLEGELGTTGVYQGYLANTVIRAQSKDTLMISTPSAMADLLDVLVELFILPASHLSKLTGLPPGTGPFVLVGQADSGIIMNAFTAYWGGKVAVKQLEWLGIAEEAERAQALLEQHVDIVSDVKVVGTDIRQHRQPSSVATTFMFNLVSGSLHDLRIRQALNYAIDKQAIIDQLFAGQATILASPCTPTQLAYNATLAPYDYHPELALRLLKEAKSEGLELCFDIPQVLPDEAPALAELLVEQLKHIGISLSVISHSDRPAYALMVRDKQIHDAACFDSSPHSSFRLFNEKFRSDKPGIWWLGYQHEGFNQLLDKAQTTVLLKQRQQLYQNAAQILHDDPPWLYLYNSDNTWSSGPRALGWKPSPDGLITFIS